MSNVVQFPIKESALFMLFEESTRQAIRMMLGEGANCMRYPLTQQSLDEFKDVIRRMQLEVESAEGLVAAYA